MMPSKQKKKKKKKGGKEDGGGADNLRIICLLSLRSSRHSSQFACGLRVFSRPSSTLNALRNTGVSRTIINGVTLNYDRPEIQIWRVIKLAKQKTHG